MVDIKGGTPAPDRTPKEVSPALPNSLFKGRVPHSNNSLPGGEASFSKSWM